MQFTVVAKLVIFNVLLGQVIAVPVSENDTEVCDDNYLFLHRFNQLKNDRIPGKARFADFPGFAASSCKHIAEVRPGSPSGYYWIQSASRPVYAFCSFDEQCGEYGSWMRIAAVNMSEYNAQCPSGFQLVTSPKRLCRKAVDSGCSSAYFSNHNTAYTKVCGRVIGYQYYSPEAFYPYYASQQYTIDNAYVDGVSITYGSNPRNHIWTFAAGLDEQPSHNAYACPCMNSKTNVAFTGLIPEFIGDCYFCDTGSRTSYQNQYYTEDPLWDGEGCGRFSTCCDENTKPWFLKELPENCNDRVEVRVCCDSSRSNEDVLLEIIEIYIK